jgi:hypothetical protein
MTDHKSLAEALAAFQAECPTLPKDATNPHFKSKFTPLDTMVEVTSPILSKHGLSWSAFPCFAPDGSPALRYVLRHVSGEVESETMPLLVQKADPQGMGSALTYARRYSLSAALNLVADEDDDGNHASRPASNPAQPQGPEANADLKAQIGPALKKILGGDHDLAKDVYKKLTVDLGVSYMPQAAAQALVTVAESLEEPPWMSTLPDPE